MIKIKCDNCQKEFKTYKCYLKRKRKHRFCSKKCEGEYKNLKNTIDRWIGGCIAKSTGYKYISYNGKQIEEHRLVMMKHLGRELTKDEVIHHINKNKLDNRIENLKLLSRKEHTKLHSKERNNKRICKMCNKYKMHHARCLCHLCYHKALIGGYINKYELTTKKV